MDARAPPWPSRPRDPQRDGEQRRAERHASAYPGRPFSRQGYEDPRWNYAAPGYGDDYAYWSYQGQPAAWQRDRDLRQGPSYGTGYRDQHYYRGYHPNLVTPSPAQDRSEPGDSLEQSHRWGSRQERAGDDSFGSSSGEGSSHAHEPAASSKPSLLLQYRESGLSSSGYELSQYIRDDADHYDPGSLGTWSPVPAGRASASAPVPPAPQKFPLPHTPVCFSAGGQLVLACPHSAAAGQLAPVELHSLEGILHDTKEQEELQAFPGPLAREDLHKVDVMTFCRHKIATSCDLSTQRGRDSALLWKLLVLLCQQNGSMVGSDTAELLMQDCKRLEKYKRQNPAASATNPSDEEWRTCGPGAVDLLTGEVPPIVETLAQTVEKFTKLLYYGRKKEALDWAMRNHLWGHALFLSSKMDPRTYSWVLTGFTSTLAVNDPLQTFFQLMSGRIPQAVQCCGDAKWGDWRPHLAVMLSNKVGDAELNRRAIVTTGDTLAGRGLTEAAHFCYLMADIPFGYFGEKANRMALLGSSHRQAFAQFARTEVIQRMEIFEYCQQLRQPGAFLLPFQVYKLIYASRLADYGLPAQALHYCEKIATVLLEQGPGRHPALTRQLLELAERLKFSDPLLLEMPDQEQSLEPDWLAALRAQCWEREMEEDVPPELASDEPELSKASRSATDGEFGPELAQNKDYQHDQRHQQSTPVPRRGTGPQEEPGPPAPAPAAAPTHVAASLPLHAGPAQQAAALGPPAPAPPGELCRDPSPPPGDARKPQDPPLPFGVPQTAAGEQPGLSARARTVSESSTISLEEDIQPSLESVSEDVTEEQSSEEEEKPDEVKSSGFRWFGWFRSKPSQATSDTPKSQERSSPSPPASPLLEARTSPSALSAWSPSPTMSSPSSGNPGKLSVETEGSWGLDGREQGALPEAEEQEPPWGPSSRLPVTPAGAIPLFNPIQVPQLAAARPRQPRPLSQRRYPHLL
ncbi:protein transport protein Sec16B-like [Nothoprocta perdicaria]|uniref:protein transport protein Sec16B-like n=1 Tax=Nothoprocta perdicaria TaxID=30464 RepID=UPI000E1C0B74|nr:protein transport protein Sec16B-like [Nothoprocta perdicaria]